MQRLYFIVPLLLMVLLSGCATFSVVRYDEAVTYPSLDVGQVKILASLPTDREFISLGEIKCSAAQYSNWNNLYKRLREEAAKLGGDAIIVNAGTSYAGTYTSPGTSQTTYRTAIKGGKTTYYGGQTTYSPGYSTAVYRKKITALVIKFK